MAREGPSPRAKAYAFDASCTAHVCDTTPQFARFPHREHHTPGNAVAMNTPSLQRITRQDALAQGFSDRQLQALVRRGTILRIRPGEFALAEEWSDATPLERHRELVLRTAERVESPQVYSHFAAASLWGIRLWNGWPDRVDVLVDRSLGGRSSGILRRRALGLDGVETIEMNGLTLTSPAQTVIDLARILPFLDAVVVADSAIGTSLGRPPLTTLAELEKVAAASAHKRGAKTVKAVLAAADTGSEGPPETASRVTCIMLGFPAPETQKEFQTVLGARRLDLWWEKYRLGGECDGRAKYSDPAMLHGRTPQEVFREEKERERALLALPEIDGLVRWEPREVRNLQRFYSILSGAGLPSRYGPPTRASWARAQQGLISAAAQGRFARHF